MNKTILIFALFLSFPYAVSAAVVNWSANVQNITVYPSGKAEITLSIPTAPSPSGSLWSCPSNIVLLGDPVQNYLLSMALTSYASQKLIRIGVEQVSSGMTCSVNYITGK